MKRRASAVLASSLEASLPPVSYEVAAAEEFTQIGEEEEEEEVLWERAMVVEEERIEPRKDKVSILYFY